MRKILKGEGEMIFTKKDTRTILDKEIEAVIKDLGALAPNTDDYTTTVSNLEKLYKMKNEEKSHRVKLDTMVIVAGNLLGILLILGYEQTDIIRTKALGFVIKGRV